MKNIEKFQLISIDSFREIFRIKDKRTARSYLTGVHCKKIGSDELYNRAEVFEKLGLTQEPTERFMTSKELGDVLGIKPELVSGYIKRMKWPYYEFTQAQGGNTYYILSEIRAAILEQMKWNPGFPDHLLRVRTIQSMLNALMSVGSTDILNDRELGILKQFVLQQQSVDEMRADMQCTRESIYGTLRRVAPLMIERMKTLTEGFRQVNDLIKDNEILKAENDLLKRQLNALNGDSIVLGNHDIVKALDFGRMNLRLKNLLVSMEVKTLIEVAAKYSRSDAAKFQNAGKKTIDLLEEMLLSNNLNWKGYVKPDGWNPTHHHTKLGECEIIGDELGVDPSAAVWDCRFKTIKGKYRMKRCHTRLIKPLLSLTKI